MHNYFQMKAKLFNFKDFLFATTDKKSNSDLKSSGKKGLNSSASFLFIKYIDLL